MKKTSLLCLLLTLTLLLGTMTGCGSAPVSAASAGDAQIVDEAEASAADEEPADDEAEADVSVEEASAEEVSDEEPAEPQGGYVPVSLPITEEPTTYTLWYSEPFTEFVDDPAEDVAMFRNLQERTNIGFEFVLSTVETASDKFQLLFAADDLPDVITDAMSYYVGSIDDSVEQDSFLYEYSADLESMPNYNYVLSMYPEAKKTITSAATGYMVSFPVIYQDVGDVSGYMMRKDYLDATGMDVPKTYDELHDVLTAIYQQTGTTLELAASGGDGLLGTGFGINTTLDDSDIGSWYVDDGVVKLGILQPEFKDYLQLVTQWYSEGIIDPDFMSSDRGDLSGLFSGKLNTTVKPPEIIAVAKMVIGVDMITVPMPRKDAADALHTCGAPTSCIMDATAWSINANVEEPAPVLGLIDYMFSEEGGQFINYGIEGETYTMENGEPVFTEFITNNPDGLEFIQAAYLYASCNRTRIPYLSDYDRCFVMYSDEEWNAVDTYSNDCDHSMDYPLAATLSTEQNTRYVSVSADIATFISENVLQYIIGQKDFSEWDAFVDTLYDMDIDTAIEAKQAAYDDFMAS